LLEYFDTAAGWMMKGHLACNKSCSSNS